MKPVKIVVVGDGGVGKTCLCITYASDVFPTDYVPTIFDNYAATAQLDGLHYNLALWDTAGQEEYDRLRPLSYPGTDIFIVCYSLVHQHSYFNVTEKWVPEVRHHCPTATILLVGTKSDLRDDQNTLAKLNQEGKKVLKYEQGLQLSKEIGASRYMECSARTMEGVNDVFIEAIKIVLKPLVTPKRKRQCQLF
ncbi:ras-related protein Rac1-like isoform X2 [Clavelina lepadiformis]|uniref:Uncharacterized protein n=1 Tax=Clavelina lepadiformis TaxID=159417 RepID=A0ABP0F188_CLALP